MPFCFMVTLTPLVNCTLNSMIIVSSTKNIITSDTFIINDWTSVNLDNRRLNQLQCKAGQPTDRTAFYANFFSLSN